MGEVDELVEVQVPVVELPADEPARAFVNVL
jgi:hypothetical protein